MKVREFFVKISPFMVASFDTISMGGIPAQHDILSGDMII